jgi:hypothetical protein
MSRVDESKIVKASFNLLKTDIEILKQLAKDRGVTVTSLLRAAIGTLKFVYDVEDKGGVVLTKDKRGKMHQLVFLKGG